MNANSQSLRKGTVLMKSPVNSKHNSAFKHEGRSLNIESLLDPLFRKKEASNIIDYIDF